MEAKARAKYIRIAPRKSRLVVDMIRGKNAAESAVILQFSTREASKAILKVLNSAVANAVVKGASGADNLFISEAFVDEGPILKRFRPRAQGRATRINKRTSHITLVLNEIEITEPKAQKAKAPASVKDTAGKQKPAAKEAAPAKKKETAKKTEPKAKKATSPAKKKEAGKKEETSGSES